MLKQTPTNTSKHHNLMKKHFNLRLKHNLAAFSFPNKRILTKRFSKAGNEGNQQGTGKAMIL